MPALAATVPPSGWTGTQLRVRLRRGHGAAVRVDGVLCAAPVWARWDGTTLWLVGSGASPVGEDSIRVVLDVGEGVHLAVRSVAATVVYAARGAGTRWDTELRVGAGASVDWRPEPVILTGRARHTASTTVHAAPDAEVTVDETIVLGRAGETPGQLHSLLDVRVEDRQVLLTSTDTSVPGWSGPAGVADRSVVASRLRVGGDVRPSTGVAGASRTPDVAVLDVDDACRLAVAATDDVADARRSIAAVLPS